MNPHRSLIPTSGRYLHGAALVLLLLLPMLPLKAQKEEILFRAMRDELTRSMDRLRLQEQDAPYYVEYWVTESEGVSLEATFGALTQFRPYRSRHLGVVVRVGDYGFDNTGYLSRDDLFSRFRSVGSGDMVLDDDYIAIRRDLWLATDEAYKDAIQQMAGKRGYLKGRINEDTLADFSHEERVSHMEPTPQFLIDTTRMVDKIRQWSRLFRKYPEIDQSNVSYKFNMLRFSLMNSEWTEISNVEPEGSVTITLSTQGKDGAKFSKSFQFLFTSPDSIPSDSEVEKKVKELVGDLIALRDGDKLEEAYIGPVLLVGNAAPQFFLQTLVPHLSGSRPPLLEDESFSNFVGAESPLSNRLNRRVMPREFSVSDDPTVKQRGGVPLSGSYEYDNQGVAARPITLIEKGVLKDLLTSRRPGKGGIVSNGHGRGAGGAGVAIGSLFIETSEMLSQEALKQQLIESCRELELDYGIMIRDMGGNSFRSIAGGNVMVSFGDDGPVAPMEAWKVYVADGREEPLRNIEPGEVDYRTLKEIVAAGGKETVLNTSTSPIGIFSFSSVPVSVVAPSILLEEVQINPSKKETEKPALLTHPYFD